MAERLKLRATLVKKLGTEKLSDTLTAESFQRTLMPEPGVGGADDAKLPEVGDVVDDTYLLVRRLGEGMFGRVYVAERTDVPEHRVALKVINRVVYAGRNVERELVMLAAATHPNIVELKDHGMTDDYVWLTMPLYDGETLAERLERGTLELREAYEIFLPIARGVEALHARNLRHQDIKPENIYLADFAGQLHPVLLDLGVAVEKNAEFVAGTALFGAPEQIEALGGVGSASELSEKVDTYCLATTLLFALVGNDEFPGGKARTPFDIASAFEERQKTPLREGTLPELEGKPREKLANALSRWMGTDPDERPGSGELAQELEVLLEKERAEKRAVKRAAARQKTVFRVAIAGALTIVVGVGLYMYSNRKMISLARELDDAKAQRDTKHQNLQSCQEGYEKRGTKLRSCNTHRVRELSEHKETILALESTSDQASSTLASKLTETRGKLLSCEDDIETGTEEREALDTKLQEQTATFETDKKKLEEARDEAETATKTCEASVETLTQTNTTCKTELASCLSGDGYADPTPGPLPRPPSPRPPSPTGTADSPYEE